jgi:hypothetical protein
LAYTPNSQPRIPTRVCQGRVVTADLPTLGTNFKQSRSGSATQEAKDLATLRSARRTVREPGADGPRAWGGRSTDTGRTVRYPQADGLLFATERPNTHPDMRTVRTWSSDGPRATGATQTVRDPQADSPAPMRTVRYPNTDGLTNQLQQNFNTSKDLRASSQELDEHATKLHLADGPQARGGQSCSPRTEQPEVKTEKSTSPIPPWISQTA